jgi:hypothetical protein
MCFSPRTSGRARCLAGPRVESRRLASRCHGAVTSSRGRAGLRDNIEPTNPGNPDPSRSCFRFLSFERKLRQMILPHHQHAAGAARRILTRPVDETDIGDLGNSSALNHPWDGQHLVLVHFPDRGNAGPHGASRAAGGHENATECDRLPRIWCCWVPLNLVLQCSTAAPGDGSVALCGLMVPINDFPRTKVGS